MRAERRVTCVNDKIILNTVYVWRKIYIREICSITRKIYDPILDDRTNEWGKLHNYVWTPNATSETRYS